MTNTITTKTHSFSPTLILGRPDTLIRLTQSYFASLTPHSDTDDPDHPNHNPDAPAPQPDPPTCAGLALALGFSTTNTMLSAATNTKHPRESRHVLMQAITAIEEGLVTMGLTDKINTSLTKHILSAQLEVIPKKEVINDPEANRIHINILGVTDQQNIQVNSPTPTQSAEELY